MKVEVATPSMASYLESFQNSTGIDLFIGRWNADYDDPDDFTYGLFHSRVGLYRAYLSSADGDQILEEARTESRPGVRASLRRSPALMASFWSFRNIITAIRDYLRGDNLLGRQFLRSARAFRCPGKDPGQRLCQAHR